MLVSDVENVSPFPIKEREDIIIDGIHITNDFVFSRGERLSKRQRKLAIKYLITTDRNLCQDCGQVFDDPFKFNLHHINGNRIDHIAKNFLLLCHNCNAHEQFVRRMNRSLAASSSLGERETTHRKPVVPRIGWTETPWSSREGEKHDTMRARWNEWINDMNDGPFQGKGGRMRTQDLAAKAVQALGIGSSITYRRYIKEDSFGPLNVYHDDGVLWAEYRGTSSSGNSKYLGRFLE